MAYVIGVVGLAPGEVAYYDELTRIHLTLSRPRANVYDYMNTSRLRRSVSSKSLMLVAGTLNPVTQINESEIKKPAIMSQATETVVEIPAEKIVEETVQIVEEVVEEKIEEVAQVIEETSVVEEASEEVEVVEEVEVTEEPVAKKKTARKKKKED